MAINAKEFEKQVGAIFTRYIYAGLKDIEKIWEGSPRFIHSVYQHYDNVVAEKPTKLKPVTTVSSEVKQAVLSLFSNYIKTLSEVTFNTEETLSTIRAQLTKLGGTVCPLFCDAKRTLIGPILAAAGDPKDYLRAKLVCCLPAHKLQSVLLIDLFDNFIKVAAWTQAQYVWYCAGTFAGPAFIGFLRVSGIDLLLLDEIEGDIRERVPRKPKVVVSSLTTLPAAPSIVDHVLAAFDAPASTPVITPAIETPITVVVPVIAPAETPVITPVITPAETTAIETPLAVVVPAAAKLPELVPDTVSQPTLGDDFGLDL